MICVLFGSHVYISYYVVYIHELAGIEFFLILQHVLLPGV